MIGKTTLSVVGALLLLAASAAPAGALSCEHRVISQGDVRARVAALCGAPIDVSQRRISVPLAVTFSPVVAPVRVPTATVVGQWHRRYARLAPTLVTVEIEVEEWVYDFGRNRLMQRIVFRDGRVVRIDSLGYGSGPPAP